MNKTMRIIHEIPDLEADRDDVIFDYVKITETQLREHVVALFPLDAFIVTKKFVLLKLNCESQNECYRNCEKNGEWCRPTLSSEILSVCHMK